MINYEAPRKRRFFHENIKGRQMKKTLLCGILLLTGQAYADFSREQVIGKWICAEDMTEMLKQEGLNPADFTVIGSSLSEYNGAGFSTTKGILSFIINSPEKINLTYKIEADGPWKFLPNNILDGEIKSWKVKRIHDTATRKKIAASKEIREMEEEIYEGLSDLAKLSEENTPDIIVELDSDSMRVQNEKVITVCTRI